MFQGKIEPPTKKLRGATPKEPAQWLHVQQYARIFISMIQ